MSAHRTNSSSTLILLATFVVVASLLAEHSAAQKTTPDMAIIERPVHRATSFVPRLGKREQIDQHQDRVGLCFNYGIDCERLLVDVKQGYNPDASNTRSWSWIRSPILAQFVRGSYKSRQPIPSELDNIYQTIGQIGRSDARSVIDNSREPDIQ